MKKALYLLAIILMGRSFSFAGVSFDFKTIFARDTIQRNCYILSLGIDSNQRENGREFIFGDCASDALGIGSFFDYQYQNIALHPKKAEVFTLVNSQAVGDSILSTLSKIIRDAGPDDYFILNFAGFTNEITDTNGKNEIYFAPYGLSNAMDTVEMVKKGISITQLSNLLEMIPANNQLIITEAGPTPNFTRDFVKSLIQNSPDLSAISKRNRIFILPGREGFDACACHDTTFRQGPINHFITTLPRGYNIFQIFRGGNETDQIEHLILKKEMDCDLRQSHNITYTHFFYERKFVNDLQYFTEPDKPATMRGKALALRTDSVFHQKVSHRYALIIGNQKFADRPYWGTLSNPAKDARAIDNMLRDYYGFETRLLLNADLDEVYNALSSYSHVDTNSQLLIFFAGHGDFDDSIFDDGFIVMSNSENKEMDPYMKTYVQYSQLRLMINKLPPKQILVIIDACYGGTFGGEGAAPKRVKDNPSDKEDFMSKMLRHKTRIYISAGRKNVVPDGYLGDHSPFTKKLLNILQDEGGDNGFLTATGIYGLVQPLPSSPIMGRFGEDAFEGDFVLVPSLRVK